jgi:hypothetical protein
MERVARKKERTPERKRPRKVAPATVHELRLGRRNIVVLAASGGVILFGFIALALGSTTLAPLLLVAGFLVGIPWGILAREKPRTDETGSIPGG